MTNFDRYLSDINAEMLQDIAKKRKRNRELSECLYGAIFMLSLIAIIYITLNTF